MEKKRNILLNSIGFFILFYGLFAISYSIYRGKPSWIFWFCYISMVIMGIGAIKKNSLLITSQINLLFFYLLFWNIDFFYQLISSKPLWGITDDFFKELLIPARIISLEHLFLLPLGFFLLYIIKLERSDHWKLSLIQAGLLAITTRFLTLEEYNVNCIFYKCTSFLPSGEFYIYSWICLNILAIFLTAFIINKIFLRKEVKKKISRK